MPAFAGFQQLGQQRVRCGQGRPALLDFQQRLHALQLGRLIATFSGKRQLLHHGVGQRGGQRQTSTVPARHGRAFTCRPAHPGRHLMDAHQRQKPPAKQETVAGLEARHKAFLHRADLRATYILHRHAGIAHDGADVHAVASRQPGIRHAPNALLVRHGTPVVRVHRQRRAALRDEGQAPFPVLARQLCIGGRAAHLVIQVIRHKTATQGNRDQVLHQHIQRLFGRTARLDMASRNRCTDGSALHHLDAVGGHQRDPGWPARRMAGAAGALEQPRHAFGRTDLQYPLDRQKINAQVQAGRADHRLELAAFQAQLHPFAHCPVKRAVVQRNHARPVGPGLEHRLVPDLGLRPGVGEDQGSAAFFDFRNHLRQHAQTQVAGPGKALGASRQQRIDDEFFRQLALHQHAVAVAKQGMHGL